MFMTHTLLRACSRRSLAGSVGEEVKPSPYAGLESERRHGKHDDSAAMSFVPALRYVSMYDFERTRLS